MPEAQLEVEAYVSHIAFPASKEELINGLFVRDAPARMVALVERLPQDRYDDFIAVVLRHVGDVRHSTKEAYNRVVEHVIHIAQRQGTLDSAASRTMQERLEATFADLRGTMTEVYDYQAPIDPHPP